MPFSTMCQRFLVTVMVMIVVFGVDSLRQAVILNMMMMFVMVIMMIMGFELVHDLVGAVV